MAGARRWVLRLATLLAAGCGMVAGGPGVAAPRDAATPCVCRGMVEIRTEPDPLRTCETGRLTIVFRPTCAAQRVHLVYVVSPSTNASWGLGLGTSARSLNLGPNPNILVATVLAPQDGAPFIQPFTNDITLIQNGLAYALRRQQPTATPNRPATRSPPTVAPPGPTPDPGAGGPGLGCSDCGVREALALLRQHRYDAAPDQVAEFIAFFGVTRADDEAAQDEPAYAALRTEIDIAKREGVVLIASDRSLASSDAHWSGGPNGLARIFGNIAVDHNGTQLRDMDIELRLPDEAMPIPPSIQPPGFQTAGNTLRWVDPPWALDGVTLTMAIDLRSPGATAVDLPRLHVRLEGYRGRERRLVLPDPATVTTTLRVADGCRVEPSATQEATPPGATPLPTATASPTRTAWPTATTGPTPTFRRPSAAFLPILAHEPCRARAAGLDALLIIDASRSMRGESLAEAVRAGQSFLDVLYPPTSMPPPGLRRAGIVLFNDTARLLQALTADRAVLAGHLEDLGRQPEAYLAPGTRIDLGLTAARDHLADHRRAGHQPVIVLLTDGAVPRRYYPDALETARAIREDDGVDVYAIGLGVGHEALFDARFLEEIAGDPARFSPAVDRKELAETYRRIARLLACG